MDIRIEAATEADAEALVRAQIAAFHHDDVIHPGVGVGGPPGYDSPEDMRHKMHAGRCYKIVVDGQIAGGFVLFVDPPRETHVGVIFIDPAYQNQGIGAQAMRFIEQQHPADRYTLDTPQWATRNQHFYEKLGYRRVREFIDEDNMAMIAYEK